MRQNHRKTIRVLAAALAAGTFMASTTVAGAALEPVDEITVTPDPATVSETITVTGPACSGDEVLVTFDQSDGFNDTREASPDGDGNWSVMWLPGAAGELQISATCSDYDDSVWEKNTTVDVAARPDLGISVSPETVAAGGSITVDGTGFWADEDVEVTLHSDPVTLGTLKANSSGAVSGSFVIPADTVLGVHEVWLLGTQSELSTTAKLTITAAASGGGTPGGGDGGAQPIDGPATGGDTDGAATGGRLAFTGTSSFPLLLAGGLALAGGTVLLTTTRRGRGADAS